MEHIWNIIETPVIDPQLYNQTSFDNVPKCILDALKALSKMASHI